ncbi:putative phospholipase [Escherichia coli]|uniref:Putative phospholipase n=1 Tax=Escherichia coli TaxID=562 RepID=A0A376KZJ8_ECOLX|nr:putative phospholipase [Escherichia coli]
MLPKRTWWNLTKSVLAFHFLRHFPALVGWLPAHTPRLAQVDPPRTTDNGNAGSGRN